MAERDQQVSVSMSRRINLRDYESADVYIRWDGFPVNAGNGLVESYQKATDILTDAIQAQIEKKVQVIRTTANRFEDGER